MHRLSFARLKIAQKMALIFLSVAFVPMLALSVFESYYNFRTIRQIETQKLLSVARNKSNQIKNYITARERNVMSLARIPTVIRALDVFNAAYRQGVTANDSQNAIDEFAPFLADYTVTAGFHDLLLISPAGDVVFSVLGEDDFGTNLVDGKYRDTELARSFSLAMQPGFLTAKTTDFLFYPPTGASAAFMAAPVFRGEALIGVVALRYKPGEFYALIQDYTGLGNTGEVLLASLREGYAIVLAPPRHDPEMDLIRTIPIGAPFAEPIQQALQTKTEGYSSTYVDYRGKQVLAVWEYLPFLQWGMVVKQDTGEVYASAYRHIAAELSFVALAALLVMVAISKLAKAITRPIVRLTETTKAIAEGNMNLVVQENHKEGFDEIHMLARSFNEMVTTRKQAEEQREVVEQQLRHAQKMEALGQLTGGIAHDFNNLLAVIQGNLELLEKEIGDQGEGAQYVRKSIFNVNRAALLTQRLLAYSRKQVLNPQAIDLSDLVQGMDDMLRRTLGEIIEFETVCGLGLWRCFADLGQVENVLINLAINARDAMPNGGRLVVKTSNALLGHAYAGQFDEVSAGRYVLLEVTDTGTGMTDEVRSHAFEPFYTTKESTHGSGLGLSMAYGFARQSGGHITISSEVGEGTMVRLYLPAFGGEVKEGRTDSESLVFSARNETVLVVEDETDLLGILAEQLEKLGYTALSSSCAEEALEIYAQHDDIDVLLTDVVLPGGMSGFDLARELLKQEPDTRVIYMTGYTENTIMQHGRPDEVVHLLRKPFSMSDLARQLRETLEDRQLNLVYSSITQTHAHLKHRENRAIHDG